MWLSILIGLGIGVVIYCLVLFGMALVRKLKEKKKVNKDIEE